MHRIMFGNILFAQQNAFESFEIYPSSPSALGRLSLFILFDPGIPISQISGIRELDLRTIEPRKVNGAACSPDSCCY